MARLEGKAVVAQGGGPTAVINQSLVGVVLQAREYSQITSIYGARNGVSGIVAEDFLDLTQATKHNLEMVACTPASGMLSTRDKPDEEYCKKIFKVLEAHDVRYFFYIGGNDSAETCRIVSENAKASNYDLHVIHVPKTVDNDLLVTDHCPGYGSAAKFVVQALIGANLDNRALPGVYISVIMGRHAGFLTAASVFAKRSDEDGPHLIYVPEKAFDSEKFIADVDAVYKKYGRCVIAASEGIVDKDGTPVVVKHSGKEERDSHGNVQLSGSGSLGDILSSLIKDNLDIKRVRSDTFGYLQRSFLGVVSDVDQKEAREVGEKAVQYAVLKNSSGSVAIKRTGDYSVEYFLTPLETVAKYSKEMPEEYINKEGNFVTEEFKKYARPLIGTIPEYATISAPQVAKILNK